MESILKDIKNHLLYIQELGIHFFPCRSKVELLDELHNGIKNCQKCPLLKNRLNLVFGQGNPDTELMFIGEGPGEEEDRQGIPFVGRSGQLLDKIFKAMKLDRTKIYIANIVKCRPPNNRNPKEDEIQNCLPYLEAQIDIIKPKVICVLGAVPFNVLLGKKLSITKNRGKWFEYRGIRLMPTFHPSYVLRNYTTETRGQVWNDMKEIINYLNIYPKKTKP